MRRAWIALGSIATVGALAFGTLNVVDLVAHEEVTERATFDAAGIERIRLDNDDGSILVEAADVDEVTVVSEVSHGLRRTRHRAEVEGSTLVVSGSCPQIAMWCSVDLRLVVPADVAIEADVDNGRITVSDVAGPVDVHGDNGSVDLDRLSGPVLASSDNGSVQGAGLRSPQVTARSDNGRVRIAFAAPPASVEARSRNGRVEVVLPEGPEAYAVQVDTDNGDTDIGVRTDPSSDRTVDARTGNGDVTVRHPTG